MTGILIQVPLALIGAAAAAPLEDTVEVKAAKAEFMAAFEQAKAGEHMKLMPEPVVTSYLADTDDVAAAKTDFMKEFELTEKGLHAEKAPKPLAPIAYAAPHTYMAASPLYYGAYASYPYYNNIYAYNTWAHHPYSYFPAQYVMPATVAKAEEEKVVETA